MAINILQDVCALSCNAGRRPTSRLPWTDAAVFDCETIFHRVAVIVAVDNMVVVLMSDAAHFVLVFFFFVFAFIQTLLNYKNKNKNH